MTTMQPSRHSLGRGTRDLEKAVEAFSVDHEQRPFAVLLSNDEVDISGGRSSRRRDLGRHQACKNAGSTFSSMGAET